jgi:hypothetical protein
VLFQERERSETVELRELEIGEHQIGPFVQGVEERSTIVDAPELELDAAAPELAREELRVEEVVLDQ